MECKNVFFNLWNAKMYFEMAKDSICTFTKPISRCPRVKWDVIQSNSERESVHYPLHCVSKHSCALCRHETVTPHGIFL